MSNMNEHLKAYIDGELSADEARQFEKALQQDAVLRKEFDEMRRISSTLREANVAPIVTGLEGTLAALAKNARPVRPPIFRLLPALGVIGTCAVALVVVGRMSGSNAPKFYDDIPMAASKKPDLANQPAATMSMGTVAEKPATPNSSDAKMEWQSNAPSSGKPRLGEEAEKDGVSSGFMGGAHTDGKRARTNANGVPMEIGVSIQLDKQIVKTGHINLTVRQGKEAIAAASKLTSDLGGFVESSGLTGDNESGMNGQLTIRVPVAKFDKAMSALEKLGKVTDRSSNGADVTVAIVDNESQIRSLKAQEFSYEKILTGAKKVDDIMTVKEKLDEVQQSLASIKASQGLLKKQAAMSTINVYITQPAPIKAAIGPVKDDWLNQSWTSAWLTLSSAGRTITEALIYLVVFCPVWIPFIVLANLFSRRLRQPA
jgi:hypothetical protein